MSSLICRAIEIVHTEPVCFNQKVPHFASRALLTALAPRLAERFYLRLAQFKILREFSGGSLRYTRALFLQGRGLNDSVLAKILNEYCFNLRTLRLGFGHSATNALAEILVRHPTVRDVKLNEISNHITAAFYVRLLDHPSEEFRKNVASLIADNCEGSNLMDPTLAKSFREQAYDAGACEKLRKMITPSVNDVQLLGVAVLALSRVTSDNERVTEQDMQDLLPSVELCLNCSDRTVHQQALRALNRSLKCHLGLSTYVDEHFPEIWPRICELIRRKNTTLPALWSAINIIVNLAETSPKIGAKFFYEFKIFDHIIERTNDADDKTIHEDSVVDSAVMLILTWLERKCVRKVDFRRERNIFRWLMKVSMMKRRILPTVFSQAVAVILMLARLDSFVDVVREATQVEAYADLSHVSFVCTDPTAEPAEVPAHIRDQFISNANKIIINRCGIRPDEVSLQPPGILMQERPGSMNFSNLFVLMDNNESSFSSFPCNDNDDASSTTQEKQNKEFDPYSIIYEEAQFLTHLTSFGSKAFPVLAAMYRAVDPQAIPHLKNLAIRGQSFADFLIENNFVEFCLHVTKRWSCEELRETDRVALSICVDYFSWCVKSIPDSERKKDFEKSFAHLAEHCGTGISDRLTTKSFVRPDSSAPHQSGECYFGDKKINEFGDVVNRFDDEENIISSGLRKIITGHRSAEAMSLNRNSLERFRITDPQLLEILRENEIFSAKRADFRVNGIDSLPVSIKSDNHIHSWTKVAERGKRKFYFDRMVDVNKSKQEYFTAKRSEYVINGGRSSGDGDDNDDDTEFNNNYSDNQREVTAKSIEEILISRCETEKQFFLLAEELFRLQQHGDIQQPQQRRRSRTDDNNIATSFLVSSAELDQVDADPPIFLNLEIVRRVTSLFSLGEEDQLNSIIDTMRKNWKCGDWKYGETDLNNLNVFTSKIRSIYAAARRNEIQNYR